MKINMQWLQFVVSLAIWQITLLSLTIPFIIFLLYYVVIYTNYQQEIIQQQMEITQRLTRIHHYQKTSETTPSLESLIAQQAEYHIPLNSPSPPEQLQHILITYHFTPETWESSPNSLYKLTFTLSYARLLTLLEHLNQTGLLLISLNIIPTKTELLSVQITLTALKELSLEQGGIS
ncbi:hypothetical protein JEP40_13315 [Proteus vulgaris]|uniref:hypothetical protein n=1 Tax=Proteus vulgaris TaxID=585 RepID=UPI0018E46AC8|nr:hypothetical protein [Proteus vulgaris]MBI6530090.1 hypothetical protein [Proteus vulgaris]